MPINVIPKFLQKAFADTGAKTNIPLNADLVNGRAGYAEGFPPINMTAVAAGGIPPFGQDMNGVLYDLSAAIRYLQSGIDFPFDSAFATAIGGYPKGALVSGSTPDIIWLCTTNNTVTAPGGAGWEQISFGAPTEGVRGIAKVATQSETNAGLDDVKIVTPKKLRAGFSANLASNGYITFPTWLGGFVIQWGVVTAANGSAVTFNYPTSFPNNSFARFASVSNNTAGQACSVYPVSNAQMGVFHNAATPQLVFFLAVGN